MFDDSLRERLSRISITNTFFGTHNPTAALLVCMVIYEAQKENLSWGETELKLYQLSADDQPKEVWHLRDNSVKDAVKKHLFG